MSRLAEIYKQEIKSGGGFGSTISKRLIEKLDPRQIFDKSGIIVTMFPSLRPYSATKTTKGTSNITTQTPSLNLDPTSLSDISAATRMTAKNTMILPAMARDLNLMRLNIGKLVKLQGGTAATKADMFFRRAGERETAFESAFSKIRGRIFGMSPTNIGIKKRDGQTKQTALYVETVEGGLVGSLLGSLGGGLGKIGKSAGGKLTGALARVIPFLVSTTLPILGVAGLAGLLYFLIRKDSGEAKTVDEMEKEGGYTPEQGGVAASIQESATKQELDRARENMRKSDDVAVRAAAIELDRRDALKNIPDETEAERRRLGLSKAIIPDSTTPEMVPNNVVMSGTGEPIKTGSGGFLVSGDTSFPITTPTPVPETPSTTPSRTISTDGVSDDLVNFLKMKENPGLAKGKGTSKAWWDYKQWSIGYGTKANSENEVITEAEAEKRLRDELEKSQKYVISYGQKKGYTWNQGQVDALTSFVYNLGAGQLDKLTNGGKRTNEEIANKITAYNMAGGKTQRGLTERRNIELSMFGGKSTPSSIIQTPSSGSTVTSASTEIADGQRMAMIPTQAGNVNVDNSKKTFVTSSSSGSGKASSVYDEDLIRSLIYTSAA